LAIYKAKEQVMDTLVVNNVYKRFDATQAVTDLSFAVRAGEIFALLGPNGAGKTTMIRMVLDILRPDTGTIQVLGDTINQSIKDRIGYLPEERGLYKNLTVLDCLAYMGRLKGMSMSDARCRSVELLERVELGDVINKKVNQLSRGMQQKAQFAATILHDPEVIIVDEPFSGLDPVNTLLIKEMLLEMKQQGKTIIMSTHMMHQVEAMADRLMMVNKGEKVLYGPVAEIRQQYADHALYISGEGNWEALPFVERVSFDEDEHANLVVLRQGMSSDEAFRLLAQQPNLHLNRFEVALPALADIFIEVVEGKRPFRHNGSNSQAGGS
jgi:ABC-2 type transport system ATP-binding protein